MSESLAVPGAVPSATLGVSLVLYRNSPKDIATVLESVGATPCEKHVCVVDNSPTDALRAVVEGAGARYIHEPSNPGFGASHNRAIRALPRTGFHLVVNPDIYFPAASLVSLMEYLQRTPEVGLVSPRVLFPNGDLQYLNKRYPSVLVLFGRRFLPRFLHFLLKKRNDHYEMRDTGYDRIVDLPVATGCFMLFRREALDRIAGFDERFFLYLEDADITIRTARAGYAVRYFPEAHVYHHWARGSYKSWRLTLASIRSSFYFFSKHGWRLF